MNGLFLGKKILFWGILELWLFICFKIYKNKYEIKMFFLVIILKVFIVINKLFLFEYVLNIINI